MFKRFQSFIISIRDSRFSLLIYATILVLLALAILGYAFATRKSVYVDDVAMSFVSPECAALESQIALQRRELETADKTKTGPYAAELAPQAEKLLIAYDKWLGKCANGVKLDEYFDGVRIRYETYEAQATSVEVEAAEVKGRAALKNGDFTTARRYFSRADSAQGRINEQYPSSLQADVNRKVAIERQLMDATYIPVLASYKSIKSEAESAFEKGEYETARSKYSALLSEIDRIAADIPQKYMSFDEAKRNSERRLMEAAARISGRDLEKAIAEADKAIEARDWKTAEVMYAKATELQHGISQSFPDSTLSGVEKDKALDVMRQKELSKEYFYEFDDLLSNMGRAIRAGDAGRLHGYIVRTDARVAELFQKYPDSGVLKDERLQRLQFLTSHQYDLIDIRGTIVAHSLKIPTDPAWRMLDREVWQLLYIRLTGNNPSARKADTLPVEGVTMEEAREFARRLSWVIADEVRIPDVETYLTILEKPDLNFVRKYDWNSVTSPTKEPQPVATSKADAHGFYDMLGNVAEWAEPPYSASSSVAFVVGGSVRDNPTRLVEVPQEQHKVTERVRNAGFRVVVRLSK